MSVVVAMTGAGWSRQCRKLWSLRSWCCSWTRMLMCLCWPRHVVVEVLQLQFIDWWSAHHGYDELMRHLFRAVYTGTRPGLTPVLPPNQVHASLWFIDRDLPYTLRSATTTTHTNGPSAFCFARALFVEICGGLQSRSPTDRVMPFNECVPCWNGQSCRWLALGSVLVARWRRQVFSLRLDHLEREILLSIPPDAEDRQWKPG